MDLLGSPRILLDRFATCLYSQNGCVEVKKIKLNQLVKPIDNNPMVISIIFPALDFSD
jgi:hypothetical protein